MLGYYKNQEATDVVLSDDGWMRTGDMGIIDSEGYLYIRGRSKSMILGANGQNIYPEEIESIVNNMQYVVESLVVEEKGTLTLLVYPDFELAESDGLTSADLEKKMEENRILLNEDLPNYCKIQNVKIFPEEFEKTPKRSIKRFLYQRVQE